MAAQSSFIQVKPPNNRHIGTRDFIERFVLLCPLFGVSFIGGSTVYELSIIVLIKKST